jgi:hypothetical protein
MRKITLAVMIVGLVCFLGTLGLNGQGVQFPKPSPKASVTQVIGLAEVTISYHSPGVKGRVIWGKLVPYDKVWRTGANEATTISFSKDVMIEGKALKAGKYGLFTIPGKEEWTIIFSKQNDIWGAMGYKEEKDALRVKVKAEKLPHSMERMIFHFADVTDNSGKVVLAWEKISVAFTIKLDTQAMVMKGIERAMGRYWVAPYQAANYAFNTEQLDKAKQYVDMSVAISATYWNSFLMAKVYYKMAKTKKAKKKAVRILKHAIQLGAKLSERQQGYVKEAKALLAEWTGKKR